MPCFIVMEKKWLGCVVNVAILNQIYEGPGLRPGGPIIPWESTPNKTSTRPAMRSTGSAPKRLCAYDQGVTNHWRHDVFLAPRHVSLQIIVDCKNLSVTKSVFWGCKGFAQRWGIFGIKEFGQIRASNQGDIMSVALGKVRRREIPAFGNSS